MTHRRMTFALWLLALVLVTPRPAAAQEPTRTFSELASMGIVQPGDSIRVTDSEGETFEGRVAALSSVSLGLTVRGRSLEMDDATIREIALRRPESRWNGFVIGLLIGAGSGAAAAALACEDDRECSANVGAVLVPTLSLVGAGVGALVDFSIRKFDPVYRRAGAGSSSRIIRVSPLLSKMRQGMEISLAF